MSPQRGIESAGVELRGSRVALRAVKVRVATAERCGIRKVQEGDRARWNVA
jgi:hypothetical protein